MVYTLTSDNQLKISYTAINSSKTLNTVINLTNHTYFNLGGEASGIGREPAAADQRRQVHAGRRQPDPGEPVLRERGRDGVSTSGI